MDQKRSLVGCKGSQHYHVFELTRQLPRFSMYTVTTESSQPCDSFVSCFINERLQRIAMWLNQNFLLSEELEVSFDLKVSFLSLRNNSELTVTMFPDGRLVINTEDIVLAGELIQSLAAFLNLEHVQLLLQFFHLSIATQSIERCHVSALGGGGEFEYFVGDVTLAIMKLILKSKLKPFKTRGVHRVTYQRVDISHRQNFGLIGYAFVIQVQVVAGFPLQYRRLEELMQKVIALKEARLRLGAEMADHSGLIRSLVDSLKDLKSKNRSSIKLSLANPINKKAADLLKKLKTSCSSLSDQE
uniref:Uncharacterized protein n=1 Tax=Timema poppense TaxID=170557 RepID=A0A7R9CWE0_TIMPO|nr:unnamed protein product [Timema poppensis]